MKIYGFYEFRGKDRRTDMNRWRATAYYEPKKDNLFLCAETLLFDSEEEYTRFADLHKDKTGLDVYTAWRNTWETQKEWNP